MLVNACRPVANTEQCRASSEGFGAELVGFKVREDKLADKVRASMRSRGQRFFKVDSHSLVRYWLLAG